MIKGVNRTIIEVPNPASRYFERALLFVRPDWEAAGGRLKSEAERFVATVGSPPRPRPAHAKERRRQRAFALLALGFALGVLCGAAAGWLLARL